MSRKHFRAFAAAISTIKDEADRRHIAEMIADVCADGNAEFKYGVFYRACNIAKN